MKIILLFIGTMLPMQVYTIDSSFNKEMPKELHQTFIRTEIYLEENNELFEFELKKLTYVIDNLYSFSDENYINDFIAIKERSFSLISKIPVTSRVELWRSACNFGEVLVKLKIARNEEVFEQFKPLFIEFKNNYRFKYKPSIYKDIIAFFLNIIPNDMKGYVHNLLESGNKNDRIAAFGIMTMNTYTADTSDIKPLAACVQNSNTNFTFIETKKLIEIVSRIYSKDEEFVTEDAIFDSYDLIYVLSLHVKFRGNLIVELSNLREMILQSIE